MLPYMGVCCFVTFWPKSKETLPVQGDWLSTQIGFIGMDEQNPVILAQILVQLIGFGRRALGNGPQTQRTKTAVVGPHSTGYRRRCIKIADQDL
jgi:hypothetical protein